MKARRLPSLFSTVGALLFVLSAVSFSMVACTSTSRGPSDEQLQRDAARTAEQAKQQSKEALQDARVAAANAEGKVNAIANGVKQGLKNSPPAVSRTDLNHASVAELASLPGITEAKAGQIIRHRPYTSSSQLVSRGILTQAQYNALAADVSAQ
jgi:DNA uptake protein ComE-like DNA-binding protein